MIKEIREQKPFIHFGFNRQEITVYLNQELNIWQDKIYSEDDYRIIYVSTNYTIVDDNKNKSTIKYNTLGTKTAYVELTNLNTFEIINSNNLIVNVVEITADAINITADSNTITADGSIII